MSDQAGSDQTVGDATAGALRVPERVLQAPAHLSPHAQAVVSASSPPPEPYPPIDDSAAWKRLIAEMDDLMLPMMEAMSAHIDANVTAMEVDGVPVFDIEPSSITPGGDGHILLNIHGGALVAGGGPRCRAMATLAAHQAGLHTWSVDYRMPPDHPYPAPLDDCVAVYRALLREHAPERIVVSGGSAGGNLAAAMIVRARDEGLPLPRAAILMTPELDLTESGDSFQTNLGVDTVLARSLMPANLLYAGGHDLSHPYVSPLFADFSLGFPPTFLQAGTRDLFLSNAVRMHRALRKAGIVAELHVFEAMPHGGFFGAPEDADTTEAVRDYVQRQLAAN